MSNIDRISSSTNLENELVRALRGKYRLSLPNWTNLKRFSRFLTRFCSSAVHYCARAEILVIGIHPSETDNRGDYQKFTEIMNLVGCWNHREEVTHEMRWYNIYLLMMLRLISSFSRNKLGVGRSSRITPSSVTFCVGWCSRAWDWARLARWYIASIGR